MEFRRAGLVAPLKRVITMSRTAIGYAPMRSEITTHTNKHPAQQGADAENASRRQRAHDSHLASLVTSLAISPFVDRLRWSEIHACICRISHFALRRKNFWVQFMRELFDSVNQSRRGPQRIVARHHYMPKLDGLQIFPHGRARRSPSSACAPLDSPFGPLWLGVSTM